MKRMTKNRIQVLKDLVGKETYGYFYTPNTVHYYFVTSKNNYHDCEDANALIELGFIERKMDTYYITEKGRRYLENST